MSVLKHFLVTTMKKTKNKDFVTFCCDTVTGILSHCNVTVWQILTLTKGLKQTLFQSSAFIRTLRITGVLFFDPDSCLVVGNFNEQCYQAMFDVTWQKCHFAWVIITKHVWQHWRKTAAPAHLVLRADPRRHVSILKHAAAVDGRPVPSRTRHACAHHMAFILFISLLT